MAPPTGYKYWDDYFLATKGKGWDRDMPHRTPDEEEIEEAAFQTQVPISTTHRLSRIAEIGRIVSRGLCPCACGNQLNVLDVPGEGTVLDHYLRACEAFKFRHSSPHATKAVDRFGWASWESDEAKADRAKKEEEAARERVRGSGDFVEIDKGPREPIVSGDSIRDDQLARFGQLEFK